MAFDVAYQDMARCNIRLIESSNACDVTVLDERTALELADNSLVAGSSATLKN